VKIKNRLLVLLLLLTAVVHAQDTTSFRYEITGATDNDDYTLKYTDRYYSNGLFLKFSAALKDINEKKPKSVKKLLTIELGQMMFNPHSHDKNFLTDLDRPFAGVLYVKPFVTGITAKENVWQLGVQAGILGPSAFGRQVQNWWHNAFNILSIHGWETQLKNEPFINAVAAYNYHLFKKQKDNPWFDAYASAAASLGNNLTNASVGLKFKIGAFEKAFQSVAWNSRIQKSKQSHAWRKNHEAYIYFEPQLTFQAYNAVLQGGMLKQDSAKGFFYTSIRPIVYQHSYGLLFAQNHWTIQFGYTFRTREAKHQIAIENYGTIRLGFRFR
jgi:hypothetical protein